MAGNGPHTLSCGMSGAPTPLRSPHTRAPSGAYYRPLGIPQRTVRTLGVTESRIEGPGGGFPLGLTESTTLLLSCHARLLRSERKPHDVLF